MNKMRKFEGFCYIRISVATALLYGDQWYYK